MTSLSFTASLTAGDGSFHSGIYVRVLLKKKKNMNDYRFMNFILQFVDVTSVHVARNIKVNKNKISIIKITRVVFLHILLMDII